MISYIISQKFDAVFFLPKHNNSAKFFIFPWFRYAWFRLILAVVVPCDCILITLHMALNQARKGFKKCLAVTFDWLTLRLLFVRSFYILGRNVQINRMIPCFFCLLSFHCTFHNSYAYLGHVCSFSLQFMYLYSIDRELKFTIWRQVLRTQPLGWSTAFEDTNVLVCIIMPELLLFPGVCSGVWGDS